MGALYSIHVDDVCCVVCYTLRRFTWFRISVAFNVVSFRLSMFLCEHTFYGYTITYCCALNWNIDIELKIIMSWNRENNSCIKNECLMNTKEKKVKYEWYLRKDRTYNKHMNCLFFVLIRLSSYFVAWL